MLQFSIRADMARMTKDFDRFMLTQVPFATAMAINTVAVKVQAAEQEQMRETFDRPTPFTVNSVAVRKATKSTQTATVFIKPVAAAYLEPYAEGGTQALPGTSRAVLNPKDTGLLNRYGGIPRNTTKRLQGRADVFIGTVTTASGEHIDGVWQRPKRTKRRKRGRSKLPGKPGKNQLRLLIRFTDPQNVQLRLPFGETAAGVIERELQPAFDAALARAMATAR